MRNQLRVGWEVIGTLKTHFIAKSCGKPGINSLMEEEIQMLIELYHWVKSNLSPWRVREAMSHVPHTCQVNAQFDGQQTIDVKW